MKKPRVVPTIVVDETYAPLRAYDDDLGADVFAVSRCIINPFVVQYNTGVKIASKTGMLVFPRSSVYKTGLIMANSVGAIDPAYRGYLMVTFYITPMAWLPQLSKENGKWKFRWNRLYQVGDRIAQLINIETIQTQFNLVNKLPDGERKSNGHGSTGR